MLAEIASGLSSLKTMKDIVQGMNAAKNEAAINGVKIELQGLILDAQQGLFAAQEAQSSDARQIAQLEQEIVKLKDWSAEKERYQLVDVWQGSVAYMPKPTMENGEPAHWLCSNCFNQGRKSFLAMQGHVGPNSAWKCGACGTGMVISARTKPTYSASS
jgi:hypothetical protein